MNNILEGNKLIAEFIGFERYYPNMTITSELSKMYYYPYRDHIFYEGLYIRNMKQTSSEGTFELRSIAECNHLKDLHFHKSWDWLMPVVEKIESIGVTTEICYRAGSKNYSTWILGLSNDYDSSNIFPSKIESVYNAVVNFIKWYNKQK